ncbi:MAG TPA: SusC/RagA family TonB-linked outer membrane protein [Longimicrobiaceae bacterium]|nr:SusC/RagA family TonB-linked outer membrane protein [Longimicrobiaceae bacterium]
MAAFLAVTFPAAARAQQGTVAGTVVNVETLEPVSGAQVTIEGTGLGTLTNSAGEFRITGVEGTNAMLRVQSIGYGTVTQQVRVGDTAIRITLGEEAIALDEIVVTGTPGAAQKRAIGNVVATIEAEDVMDVAPVGNLQELINGRVAGAVVLQSTGMVGSGSRIQLRGASSFSLSNAPLIYIDGIRTNSDQSTGPTNQGFGSNSISRFNDINPEDIASIEIIKGPAAATLYGTEASGGVIQIITKKGIAGEPRFNLKITQGANWFNDPQDRLWTNYAMVDGELESIDFNELEAAWGDDIFHTGHLQEYDLSARGGADAVSYYAAGGFVRNEGIEPENKLLRYNGRMNLTVRPNEKLDATLSLGYVAGRTDLVWESGAGGVTWSTYYATPANLGTPRHGFYSGTPESYYALVDTWQDLNRFTGSIQFNHRPTDWFTQRLAAGTDHTREQNVELFNRDDQYVFFDSFADRGYKDVLDRNSELMTLDYSGTLSFPVNDRLTSNTSFGAQYYRDYSEYISAYGEDFPVPGLTTIEAAAIQRGTEDYIENTTVGVFGQQQVAWNNRLFLTAGLRADDNSAFGEQFDIVYYPKVSASWVVSEEPFWNFGVVNQLRVRAAYGQSGQQPEAFAALRTFEPVPGPGDVGVVTPGTIGNPALGPERSEEIELGFDASMFDSRLGFEFTYYDQTTRDAILLRRIAPSSGFAGSQFVNAGEVTNSGLELVIDALPYRSEDVSWDLRFSIATNENEVVDLGDVTDEDFIQASSYIQHRLGYPIGSWFAREVVSADFDASGEAINIMCEGGPENNGEAVPCDVAPPVFLGRTSPRTQGAFSTTLTLFDNLQLFGLLDYKLDYSKLDGNERVRCALFLRCRANYFPEEFSPVLIAGYQELIPGTLIHDASFAKLRELSATYTIPQEWSGRIGTDELKVTVAGRNLGTWTNYDGLEPEATFHGGSRGGDFAIWEQNVIPQLRQFVVSVDIAF